MVSGLKQQLKSSCASCTLNQLCLPAGIDKDSLHKLDDIVLRQKPLSKGQTIYQASDPFERIYVVRTGSVKTYYQGSEGDDQILGFHFPGDVLGLDALNAEQHGCTAEVLEHTSVCEFPFEHLEQVAAELPALRHQFLKVISREMVQE
ncbi:MAG: cyclic nucleotide-binding domain-containing protein, partial [bacterium]